jgi:hypothetical protein
VKNNMRFTLKEVTDRTDMVPAQAPAAIAGTGDSFNIISPQYRMEEECGCECEKCQAAHMMDSDEIEITPGVLAGILRNANIVVVEEALLQNPSGIFALVTEKKKKGDRCVRIAKRKYHKWPSAYASGAVVKCRQGKIWSGLKEGREAVEYEIYEMTLEEAVSLVEKYKPNFSLEKDKGLHGWFQRNKGKGWIDCKTGKSCGRDKAGRGTDRKYPACRPTKAQCNKSGTRKKKTGRSISWTPKKDK